MDGKPELGHKNAERHMNKNDAVTVALQVNP